MRENLRRYRDRAGLSQRQVAGELGLSRSAYTYYETGKTSAVDLFTLAQLYRVPVEEFFRRLTKENAWPWDQASGLSCWETGTTLSAVDLFTLAQL